MQSENVKYVSMAGLVPTEWQDWFYNDFERESIYRYDESYLSLIPKNDFIEAGLDIVETHERDQGIDPKIKETFFQSIADMKTRFVNLTTSDWHGTDNQEHTATFVNIDDIVPSGADWFYDGRRQIGEAMPGDAFHTLITQEHLKQDLKFLSKNTDASDRQTKPVYDQIEELDNNTLIDIEV